MIVLKEEEKQKLFGLTNGCVSCSANKLEKDIKEIQIIPKCGGRGIMITLCKDCRDELKELLSDRTKEKKDEKLEYFKRESDMER